MTSLTYRCQIIINEMTRHDVSTGMIERGGDILKRV